MIGGAVKRPRAHQVDAGVDVVSDGEMSKIGYATYIRHRLSGFEVGDVPRATPADLDAYPSFRDRLAPAGATAKYLRPICRGPIAYEHREPLERDLAHLRAAIEGQPRRGRVHERPVARGHRAVPAQRVLRHARRVPRRARRGDEGRVRGHRRRRLPAADRRAGPRDGPPHHVPRRARRGVRRARRPCTSRRSTTRCATSRPTACACTCAGATTRARTTSTSRVEKIIDDVLRAEAADDPVRGGQPAPRARVGGVARRDDPRRQGPHRRA